MSAGVLSILSITTLIILLYTGWLPSLAKRLDCKYSQVIWGLIVCFLLNLIPIFSLTPQYEVEPGIFVVIGLLLFFIMKLRLRTIFFLQINIILLGSLIFLWHEIFDVQTKWDQSFFRISTLIGVTLISLIMRKTILEKLYLQIGSYVFAHVLMVLIYTDVVKPVTIGDKIFLDSLWLGILCIILCHFGLEALLLLWNKRYDNLHSTRK
ncbi:hypothetical protein [Thermoflavimicrobium daqui]|uniref:Uncharacterized protein n=1 Tax=Thermoflavimicrobium daqui TaxID=2137476 RepID=A0A364K2N3_9BACL|nr:hypothetical protein [Thermoflavimicrobium daqui]RAL22647.1 hypothetical protein DL897_13335 [Thermoflavimicrobium daqui]